MSQRTIHFIKYKYYIFLTFFLWELHLPNQQIMKSVTNKNSQLDKQINESRNRLLILKITFATTWFQNIYMTADDMRWRS